MRYKIVFSALLAWLLAGSALAAASSTGAVSYKTCESISDYISYVKCIADVDAQNSKLNGQASSSSESLPGNAKDYAVVINDGAEYTNKLSVSVKLKAPAEATVIAISRDSNFGFSPREPFAASKNFLLDEIEDSAQYVYVKFFDKNGQALFVGSDAISYSKTKGDPEAEAWATEEFLRLFGRSADATNAEDAKALSILAYDLAKTIARDLKAEAVGLKAYQKLYRANPADAKAWKAVKALAYAKVQAEAGYQGNPAPAVAKACQLAKPLTLSFGLGDRNAQVAILKQFLFCHGLLAKEDKTELFDELTEKAIKSFQEKNDLKCKDGSYCGYFGPSTRKALSALVASSTTSSAGQTTSSPALVIKLKLKQNLTVGIKSEEVKALQQYLAEFPEFYPEAKVSGLFDEATEQAVSRFQEKYGLKCKDGSYCGYVGPATRNKLNQLMK